MGSVGNPFSLVLHRKSWSWRRATGNHWGPQVTKPPHSDEYDLTTYVYKIPVCKELPNIYFVRSTVLGPGDTAERCYVFAHMCAKLLQSCLTFLRT